MKDNKGTMYPFSKSKQKIHLRAYIFIMVIFIVSLIYKFSYLINSLNFLKVLMICVITSSIVIPIIIIGIVVLNYLFHKNM
jgi:hypothetical protein